MFCFQIMGLIKLDKILTMKSTPARIEPPRKNPKLPPSCPMTHVKSQEGYSLTLTNLKFGNPRWIEFSLTPSSFLDPLEYAFKLYFVNLHGLGHSFDDVVNLSECPK